MKLTRKYILLFKQRIEAHMRSLGMSLIGRKSFGETNMGNWLRSSDGWILHICLCVIGVLGAIWSCSRN